jgi:hypothetical protein
VASTPVHIASSQEFGVSTSNNQNILTTPTTTPQSTTSQCTNSLDATPTYNASELSSSDSAYAITYPAPLPNFTPMLEDTLKRGNKAQILMVYSDIIAEAAHFYLKLMPVDSNLAKLSFESIGRTLIESYPVLAVTDCKVAWSFFNGKLSSAVRNMRCRMKRKLSAGASPTSISTCKPKKIAVISKKPAKLTDIEYNEQKLRLKKEWSKALPDIEHCRLLMESTYVNRQEWISSTPSTELRLKHVLDEFPSFSHSDFVKNELWLNMGEVKESSFKG